MAEMDRSHAEQKRVLLDGIRVLLDRRHAAEALATSPRRVDDLRRAGVLTAVQDGREWKFRPTDLEAYAASLATSA